MRILIITSNFELGGAENHAFKLAKYFKKEKKFEVQFWVFDEKDLTTKKMCDEQEIPTRVLTCFYKFKKFPYFIIQIIHYTKRVRKFKPDCIISFNLMPNIWNGLISKFSGVRCSIWSQQSEINYKFNNPLEKYAIKSISFFVSNAQHASTKLFNSLPIKRDINDFHVIHNGIDEQIPKNSKAFWHNYLELDKFNFVVTMVANITRTKDHETLIRAWKIVLNELATEKTMPLLVLAGRKGDTYENINTLIQELNIASGVRIIGPTDDIPGLNISSNLGILSSKAEGLPNSVMEQMAVGLPVIGTANDGTIEALGEEMIKYLSPINSVRDLAEKIMLFISNPDLCKEVGNKNKIRIHEYFSIVKMGEGTLNIIKKK